MNKELLVIDQIYKYEIDQILEGGMGRVLLMTRLSAPNKSSLESAIYDRPKVQDRFRIPYREKLAAKTVREDELMRDFERECIIWLGLDENGIVPLLKVVKINGKIFALMPRYSKSLRDLLESRNTSSKDIIKLLYNPILGLANIYSSKGLVHQDIKPENFLCDEQEGEIKLFLSDWGIANVQANLLLKTSFESKRFTFQTMAGFGTLPYMAPERFINYYSSIGADIFSLGLVFLEILTGNLPYDSKEAIEDQIISGKYYFIAKNMLSKYNDKNIVNTILLMIHPLAEKRMQNYSELLKFIKSV